MLSNCKDAMDNSPIIAAIKDIAGLKKMSHLRQSGYFYPVWRHLQYCRYCR